MKYEALRFEDSPTRFAAAFLASSLRPGAGGSVGPLRHRTDIDPPALPGPDWVHVTPRLSGICGSDLAALDGRSSRWFEPVVSLPFVPGHEVVADHEGRRVVLEPVLGCTARGTNPPCRPCSEGRTGNCERLEHGCVSPGMQTGFCEDTGGGWSTLMAAHPSQLHTVPDDLDDEAAVMVEPTACALHGALAAEVGRDETAAVLGGGTMGLAAIAALARWSPPRRLLVVARHPHQRRLATGLASGTEVTVVSDGEELRAARRITGSMLTGSGQHQRVDGGVDVTIDCVGSGESITSALALTRPGGRVVLIGMPSRSTLDLTPLWQREISVRGAYTYGTETLEGESVRTFELSMELVAAAGLGALVSAHYPLRRATDATSHAARAGSRGATKICFDMRDALDTEGRP